MAKQRNEAEHKNGHFFSLSPENENGNSLSHFSFRSFNFHTQSIVKHNAILFNYLKK